MVRKGPPGRQNARMSADSIRSRREALHWTQQQLADAAAVSRSAVSVAEGGKRSNKPSKLAAILAALDDEERRRATVSTPSPEGVPLPPARITLAFVDTDGARATYEVPVGDTDPYEVAQAMIEAARRRRAGRTFG